MNMFLLSVFIVFYIEATSCALVLQPSLSLESRIKSENKPINSAGAEGGGWCEREFQEEDGENRLKRAGHVERMKGERLTKIADALRGRRRRGRLRLRLILEKCEEIFLKRGVETAVKRDK